jgi:hypothetical protein
MNNIPSISSINIEDLLKDLDDREAQITISSEDLSDTITLSGNLFNNSTITGGGFTVSPGYGAVPNVSISSPGAMTGTIGSNTNPWTYSSVSGGPYTINSGAGTGSPWATNVSPKIRLDGEGADIEVNGWSLMDAIQKIEQRLNILHPNTQLETEWEELRDLGEQYRKLEQHIKDKQATWDRLKAMPPPEID